MNTNDNTNLIDALCHGLTAERFVKYLFYVIVALVAFVNVFNLSQPILEAHSFRQTQTALTAYYLQFDGFSFQYKTPVIGMGWSIPFEFPIYQEIVALLASFGVKLTVAGRTISLLFGLLTCMPIYKSLHRMGVGEPACYYVLTLYLSAPVYMFWSGSFMIETAATFFSVSFLYFFIKILQRDWSLKTIFFSAFFLLCALLQKATTVLPILIVLLLILVFFTVRFDDLKKNTKSLFSVVVSVLVPFSIAYAWVIYSDQVKLLNPIGEALTSKALSRWNYGSFDQRISAHLWKDVIYERVVKSSAFNFMGLISIVLMVALGHKKNTKTVVAFAIIMFLLPFLIFTNLHVVHDYYQVSNVVFLSAAVGVSVYYLAYRFFNKHIFIFNLVLLSFVASNVFYSYSNYYGNKFAKISEENNRTLKLSRYLKYNTDPYKPIVVYGYDWSSEVAFYSERKALTLPWGRWDLEVINNPEKFLKNAAPSAYIICPNKNYELIKSAIQTKFGFSRNIKIADCEIFQI